MDFNREWFMSPASADYARRAADEFDSAVTRGEAEGTRRGWWDFLDWKANGDGSLGVEKELLTAGCDPEDVGHDYAVLVGMGNTL
jgi:hypothetical protein